MYITLESFFRGSICGVLLELMSGIETISNEHFRVDYTRYITNLSFFIFSMNRRTKQRNVAKCRSGNGTSELLSLVKTCFSNVHQTVIENRELRFSTLLAGFYMEV